MLSLSEKVCPKPKPLLRGKSVHWQHPETPTTNKEEKVVHSLKQLVLSIPKTFAECLERDKKKFPTEYPDLPSPVSGRIARSRSHSLPLVTVPTHSRLIRNRTRIG